MEDNATASEPSGETGKRRRRWYLGPLVACAAVALLLILGELGVRAWQWAWPQPVARQRPRMHEYDPLLGWRTIRGQTFAVKSSEFDVQVSFNSKGTRGPERGYSKPPGVYRILVVGDSFSEGATVAFESLFSHVLEAKLSEDGKRNCEVINAGVAAYSTDQELLYFANEGRKYKPDLTVLVFCFNDVWLNAQPTDQGKAKPMFALGPKGLRLASVPGPRAMPQAAPAARPVAPRPSPSVKTWLRHHSRLYIFVRDRLLSQGAFYRWAIRRGIVKKAPFDTTPGPQVCIVPHLWRVFEKNPMPQFKVAWQLTEALLVRFRKATAAAGSKLLVVNVPTAQSIYPNVLAAMKRKYGISDEEWRQGWNAEQPGLELAKICRRNRIDYLDPTDRFKSEAPKLAKKGRWLNFPIDGHWTPDGHRLVAETIYERIKRRYLKAGGS